MRRRDSAVAKLAAGFAGIALGLWAYLLGIEGALGSVPSMRRQLLTMRETMAAPTATSLLLVSVLIVGGLFAIQENRSVNRPVQAITSAGLLAAIALAPVLALSFRLGVGTLGMVRSLGMMAALMIASVVVFRLRVFTRDRGDQWTT